MNTRTWIGNDVVDLAEPGVVGKERDRRFMDRVFSADEQARILDAVSPSVALWKTWAAKETAFKIASKLRRGVVFAHRKFQVGPVAAESACGTAAATSLSSWASVQFEDLHFRVRWETAIDYIHCIGHFAAEDGGGTPNCREASRSATRPLMARVLHHSQAIGGMLSRAERASVYSTASERARLLARHLMERWDLQCAEIMRFRRAHGWSPPVISCAGEPLSGFDISLSHDGRFVAAVLSGPA